MKYSSVYNMPRHVGRINRAGQEFWMYKAVYIPIVIALSLLDAVTLFTVFHAITGEDMILQFVLTFGIALTLNFIPLIIGRLIYVIRYAKIKEKKTACSKFMMALLITVFIALFFASLALRYVARGNLLDTREDTKTESVYAPSNDSPETDVKLKTYALLTGIVPLVTSVINMTLGYLTGDPVRERIDKLTRLRAEVLNQLNLMCAARNELDRDWSGYHSKLEDERYKVACGEVHGISEQIKETARVALKEKLGDPKSITELSK